MLKQVRAKKQQTPEASRHEVSLFFYAERLGGKGLAQQMTWDAGKLQVPSHTLAKSADTLQHERELRMKCSPT